MSAKRQYYRRMKTNYFLGLTFIFTTFCVFGQQNSIVIEARLIPENNQLTIHQEIVFFNNTEKALSEIYLHNWANSFRDKDSPLTNRFIENHDKSLYFAKKEERGYSKIHGLFINHKEVAFEEVENHPDILKITLEAPLPPESNITIQTDYTVKLPSAKFTGYGKTQNGYHLRFWYLTTAVYQGKWELMSNINIDDLQEYATDFKIKINLPKKYSLESNLYKYKTDKKNYTEHYLVGKNKTDVIISMNTNKEFKAFTTKKNTIYTNVFTPLIDQKLSLDILNRELLFIEDFLGEFPHKQIFIDRITQSKSPIYGLNKMPRFLDPFPTVFKWDMTMFKAIANEYIENTLLLNKRTDYWLMDGLQTYLMMKYVEKNYPEMRLFGKYSNLWGLRSFNVAKLKFNEKYPFVYRFSARQFLDQALTTSADSLSNFNRKIVNKYKAGLGLQYLEGFIGNDILKESIKEYFQKNRLKTTSTRSFSTIISKKTEKDISWFFGDYIQTNKKIDYAIDKANIINDSINIVIENKRNITAPVALYGLKGDSIVMKQWISNIKTSKKLTIPKENITRLILNYEQLYPEYNYLNNAQDVSGKILKKPIRFTFLKDIESPNHNQIFYKPIIKYNFYDGTILGVNLSNKPLIAKNFEISIAPAYATKSNSFAGNFSILYNQFFEQTAIYNIGYGLAGGTQHYAENLSYNTLTPFILIDFKRNSLRDVRRKRILAKMINIDKENLPGIAKSPEDKYHVFNLSYSYNKPDIIKGISYRVSGEYASNFSKIEAEYRYRRLTATDRQLDFRLYAGAFLHNKTEGDYFSFGLDRANDYLFELGYLGRSESSGIFSQQFILAEGGFKSILSTRFANQFMLSGNSSIGIWRWLEVYNDAALLKNKNENLFFGYESGIRLNFINNIFEIYLPLYSNNGFEFAQENYQTKIRFVVTANPTSIYNYIRRGLF